MHNSKSPSFAAQVFPRRGQHLKIPIVWILFSQKIEVPSYEEQHGITNWQK
jgi:hypothetical protein